MNIIIHVIFKFDRKVMICICYKTNDFIRYLILLGFIECVEASCSTTTQGSGGVQGG